MKILAFDTATAATTVALDLGAGEVAEARDDPELGARPAHAVRLLALITQRLDAAATDWRELERIAVGTGPGTFTGLRIGIATARALAQAHGLPLSGISTLHSLAARAGRERPDVAAVLAVLDARRGEVFTAAWTPGGAGVLAPPAALRPEQLRARVAELPAPVLAVGDGVAALREHLEAAGVAAPADDSPLHRVSAAEHCRLARHAPAADPQRVHPEYLRLPDAEISRRARAAAAGGRAR